LEDFALYALRWQLSTLVLAPVIAYLTQQKKVNFIYATAVGNFIGAIVFFFVDKAIFR